MRSSLREKSANFRHFFNSISSNFSVKMSSIDEKPVFRDLSADDPDPECTEIESMCMNCHKNGMTRILLTRIPYFKNVILMSFSCEECGYENNEIQPGGAYGETGVRWELQVTTPEDLNRQVVKSDHTGIVIPEVEFEIPPESQKGEVTTVEGILSRAIAGLTQDQARRREEHPETAAQIDLVAAKLQGLKALDTPWTLKIEDVSGNCFVENPHAPAMDPRCRRTDFTRSRDQDHSIGIYSHEEVRDVTPHSPSDSDYLLTPADPSSGSFDKMAADEVLQFRTNCPECNAPADTNMKITDIPHFKQVVIMATNCDACGHRTNEVKSGGGIEDKGVRFEVKVAERDDFSRDILKSETCCMEIPELDLEVGGHALGGRFTTVEGVLLATRDQLAAAPGAFGDAPALNAEGLHKVLSALDDALSCRRAVTLILDDPAGNSYVQSLHAAADTTTTTTTATTTATTATTDGGLKITRYERTFEQNEELGLNDMKTEGYEDHS